MEVQSRKYTAFGLVIESEIPLPQLLYGVGEPHVHINFGNVPASLAKPAMHTPWYQASKNHYLLKVDGIARYYVEGGSTITIEPYSTATMEDITVFLLSSVIAVLLQQREYLVLHGAAVDIAGKAVVLTGHSGVGKTALSLALCDRGYPFITDEICAIRRQNGKTVIYPGFPELHVWHDTLSKENREDTDYKPVRCGIRKYVVNVGKRFCHEKIEVSQIVVLDNHKQENINWQSVKGVVKLEELMRYTFQPRLAENLEKVNHFQLYTAIGITTVMSRLTYNQMPYQAREIADFLLQEVKIQ